MITKNKYNLGERTEKFAESIIKLAEKITKTVITAPIISQLVRSGTSIGANMEEADGAASKNDFINKVTIARKEARETRYWLLLIKRSDLLENKENDKIIDELITEVLELMKILSAIINKAREAKTVK